MNKRFTVQVRGNITYPSTEVLQDAITEFLSEYPQFNLDFHSVEVWTDNEGAVKTYADEMQRFTLQIRGHIDAESQEDIETLLAKILTENYDFILTYKAIEVWSYDGNPRLFNDDGTEYIQQVADSAEDTELADEDKLDIEEVSDESAGS